MNMEEIKNLFFKYNCNISFLLRDNIKIDDNIYNIIISNFETWVDEFLEVHGKIINETDDFLVLAKAFSEYKNACRNYIDLFNLSQLLKNVILRDNINSVGLFIYYYELIIKNIKNTQNDSSYMLIDYIRIYDFEKYPILITDIKEVLNKDKNLSSEYCQILKYKIENMICD